jgi:hypothetical protein
MMANGYERDFALRTFRQIERFGSGDGGKAR